MKKTIFHIKELVKSCSEDQKKAKVYFFQGNGKFYLKDYHGAIADYTEAIMLDPKHTMAYYYRGCTKILLQDSKGAIEDLNKAVEIPLLSKDGYFGDGANLIQ